MKKLLIARTGIGGLAIAAIAFTVVGFPTTTSAAPTGCPAGNFPDLSTSVGAGAGYAKPTISASCAGNVLTVKSNGMISYPFVPKTPNSLKAQEWVWTIPVSPTVAKSTTAINTKDGNDRIHGDRNSNLWADGRITARG